MKMLLWQKSFFCQGYCCGKHKDYCGKYKGCCRKYKDCCNQCKYCCHKCRYYSGKYKYCCGKYKYCCGKCSWLGGERCSRLSQSTRPQLGLIAPSSLPPCSAPNSQPSFLGPLPHSYPPSALLPCLPIPSRFLDALIWTSSPSSSPSLRLNQPFWRHKSHCKQSL